MLNTFYNRNCADFTVQLDYTVPCQTLLDFGLVSVAAAGATMGMNDERVALLGFVPTHLLATVFFIISTITPSLLGLTSTVVFDAILQRTVAVAFRYQFPFVLMLSFFGGLIGMFFGGKLSST